jgi:hypothetical protein
MQYRQAKEQQSLGLENLNEIAERRRRRGERGREKESLSTGMVLTVHSVQYTMNNAFLSNIL